MRIYQSGLTGGEFGKRFKESPHYESVFKWLRHRLLSWPYITSEGPLKKYRAAIQEGKYESFMLDSGAFSAWTKGISLDMDQYVEFFFNHQDIFNFVVAIDKLPSFFGDKSAHRLVKEFEVSAETSWRNTEYLLSKGLPKDRLVPVFHQGEDFKWLEFLLKQGFFLIGISPGNDRGSQDKRRWVRDCFEIIGVDSVGRANQRCHGFAVTDWALAKMVPWFSVDSATWCISSGHGNALVPGGAYKDFLNPKFVSVGRKGDEQQKRGLEEYFLEHLNMTLEEIKAVHTNRVITHLYCMDRFVRCVKKTRPYLSMKSTKRGFFND